MREVDDEDDLDELKERRICENCVGDEFLKKEITAEGQEANCDYCAATGKTISIEELADRVERAFEDHYVRTRTEPSAGYEYAMAKEEGGWERPGEETVWAIGEAASIDEDPARHVQKILADRHYDLEAAQMGDESDFDEDACYEPKDIDDNEFQEAWNRFEESVTAETRHFNSKAESILGEIFGDLSQYRTVDGRSAIVEAGPDKEIKAFYRARVFQASGPLLNALKYPDREVGPPPAHEALAGRMNPRGVSVFYGATERETAIAEVRPPVGSRVVTGRFELLRSVRLLDVRMLKDVAAEGSIFDPAYLKRRQRAKFLERLSERVSMAVMPNDEPLDYIVTQVIADYLATRKDPVIDGILYASSQKPDDNANVVLFHKSSRVQIMALPPGSTVDADNGWNTGDGWEENYQVWEKVPRPKNEEKPTRMSPDSEVLIKPPCECEYIFDSFAATLKLDAKGVYVHRVNAVEYEAPPHRVARSRMEKIEPEASTPDDEAEF